MNEKTIETFWQANPCGENLVPKESQSHELFFEAYDAFRYETEPHILKCLDRMDVRGKQTLEIGLGQGADSEQLIRRGAVYSGLDLTQESVKRVTLRLQLRNLPYQRVAKGSALEIPWPDNSFDVVFSHGVLHHIPDIDRAQNEIARVLRPNGRLVIMLYAKYSLNYLVSISLLRRLGLAFLYLTKSKPSGIYRTHLELMRQRGFFSYLRMNSFLHRNTDGPHNPYSKVYDLRTVKRDFSRFKILETHKEFMHAPPLPVHGWPGASLLGWHLWAHLAR